MAVTPKRLYHDAPPNADTTLYTATELTEVLVILCTNTTGGPLTVSVRIDPAGAGGSEDLLNSISVPANDAIRLAGPFHLEVGDTLVGRNHTAALGVTIYAGGIEVT